MDYARLSVKCSNATGNEGNENDRIRRNPNALDLPYYQYQAPSTQHQTYSNPQHGL